VKWRVIQAAVAGTSHHREQLPCQDHCVAATYECGSGEVLAIVVADGAGSACHGGRGAQLACQGVRQAIEAWVPAAVAAVPTTTTVAEWLATAREVLLQAAAEEGASVRDFACTLLIAVITARAAGYAHIGDGGIVIDGGDGLQLVFWPEAGEYANMTRFITDEDALEQVRVLYSDAPPDEIAVFTDGIQRLALDYKARAVHGPFFAPMLAVLRRQLPSECAELAEQLAAFLASPRVNSRTDDDKTLVLASRRE